MVNRRQVWRTEEMGLPLRKRGGRREGMFQEFKEVRFSHWPSVVVF